MSLSLPRTAARLSIGMTFATTASRPSSVEGTKKEEKPLYATAPSHRSYIFLHASEPPASFPARVSTPIQRALQLKVMKWGGAVNFSWFGPPKTTGQAVTAFSTLGGRLEIPDLTLENLDEVEGMLQKHALEGPLAKGSSDEIYVYVCTHGARDCRCGETGGAVYSALQDEVARLVKADPFGVASRIRIGETGHVGGHQYAANILVYPHGEWLGNLKPADVPAVLSRILDSSIRPYINVDKPILPLHWRGRMGLHIDEREHLFQSLHLDNLHRQ